MAPLAEEEQLEPCMILICYNNRGTMYYCLWLQVYELGEFWQQGLEFHLIEVTQLALS